MAPVNEMAPVVRKEQPSEAVLSSTHTKQDAYRSGNSKSAKLNKLRHSEEFSPYRREFPSIPQEIRLPDALTQTVSPYNFKDSAPKGVSFGPTPNSRSPNEWRLPCDTRLHDGLTLWQNKRHHLNLMQKREMPLEAFKKALHEFGGSLRSSKDITAKSDAKLLPPTLRAIAFGLVRGFDHIRNTLAFQQVIQMLSDANNQDLIVRIEARLDAKNSNFLTIEDNLEQDLRKVVPNGTEPDIDYVHALQKAFAFGLDHIRSSLAYQQVIQTLRVAGKQDLIVEIEARLDAKNSNFLTIDSNLEQNLRKVVPNRTEPDIDYVRALQEALNPSKRKHHHESNSDQYFSLDEITSAEAYTSVKTKLQETNRLDLIERIEALLDPMNQQFLKMDDDLERALQDAIPNEAGRKGKVINYVASLKRVILEQGERPYRAALHYRHELTFEVLMYVWDKVMTPEAPNPMSQDSRGDFKQLPLEKLNKVDYPLSRQEMREILSKEAINDRPLDAAPYVPQLSDKECIEFLLSNPLSKSGSEQWVSHELSINVLKSLQKLETMDANSLHSLMPVDHVEDDRLSPLTDQFDSVTLSNRSGVSVPSLAPTDSGSGSERSTTP